MYIMISHYHISAKNTVRNHEGLITAEFCRFSTLPLVTCHNIANCTFATTCSFSMKGLYSYKNKNLRLKAREGEVQSSNRLADTSMAIFISCS